MEATQLFENCVVRLIDQLGQQALTEYELANNYIYFPGAPHLVNAFLAAVRQNSAHSMQEAVAHKEPKTAFIPRLTQELVDNQWIEQENAEYIIRLLAKILIPVIVGQSANSDFVSLREAYDSVEPYSTIHLLPGTYNESLVLTKPIAIVGVGKQGEVVLESKDGHVIESRSEYAIIKNLLVHCGAEASDSAHAIYLVEGQLSGSNLLISSESDSNIKVEGNDSFLALRNCKIAHSNLYGLHFVEGSAGLIENCQIFQNENVGVCLEGNSKPILRACRIFKNNANGVACDQESYATFEDCEIFENEASGVTLDDQCAPTFRKCWIYRNNGDGLFCDHATQGKFEYCWFYENQYLGVVVEGESKPEFFHCRVYKNKDNAVTCDNESTPYFEQCAFSESLVDAVVLDSETQARFVGCNFQQNTARALTLRQRSKVRLEGCTFSENKGVPLLLAGDSDAEVEHCIFKNNLADSIVITTQAKGTFTDCKISGTPLGVLIKDKAAPFFRNSLFYNNDYNLRVDSKNTRAVFENCTFYGGEQSLSFATEGNYLQNCKIETAEEPVKA
jgi:parallel beta-helix repeat protein